MEKIDDDHLGDALSDQFTHKSYSVSCHVQTTGTTCV